ncbi:hypothetical protein [Listeria rustica]|uniref:DUF4340 domain-containing protein n=1 Tax=Listeria rustica TaxID=2713503 RepID=A0A7W1YG70_9LIST|nr:hypothetical protein [Listeria rustica]MBA3926314.1 hypothetical protein [Listeria rustica]
MRWKVAMAGLLALIIGGVGYLAFDYQHNKEHMIIDWAGAVKHQGEVYSYTNMELKQAEIKSLLGKKLGKSIDNYDDWKEGGKDMPELASTYGVMDIYTMKGYPESQRIIGLREDFNGLEIAVFEKEDPGTIARLLDNYRVARNIRNATYQVKYETRTMDDTVLLEKFVSKLGDSKERSATYFSEETETKNFVIHLEDGTNVALAMDGNGFVTVAGFEVQLKKDAMFEKMYKALADAEGDMSGEYVQMKYGNQDYAEWGEPRRALPITMVGQQIGTTKKVSEEAFNDEGKVPDFHANVAGKNVFHAKMYNPAYKLVVEQGDDFVMLTNNSMDMSVKFGELLNFREIDATVEGIKYESAQSWLFVEQDFQDVANLEVAKKLISALERAKPLQNPVYSASVDKRHVVLKMLDGNELEFLVQEDGIIAFENNYFELAEQDRKSYVEYILEKKNI